MKRFTRYTRRGAETLRRERTTHKLLALPANTAATAAQSGFQRMEAAAKTKTKSGGTTMASRSYSWEPDYLAKYTAVYPMDKNLLFRVLSVQTDSGKTQRMEKFILDFVRRLEADGQPISAVSTGSGNIYVIKGAGPVYPTIVAHTDTVHDIVPNDEYQVRSNGKVMWATNPKTGMSTGIGGDDKVGIFVALSMLRDLPTCKAAFFVDEEIGCVGSSLATPDFFADSAFVLQCDRKGNEDFVDRIMGTELYGAEFATAIKTTLADFGYSETLGGMTDVWQLKELGVDVACMNMSCGYFSPHSRWETVGILDVQRCYDLVQTLCQNLGDVRWSHTVPVAIQKGYYTKGGVTYEYDLDSPYRPYNEGWGMGWGETPSRTRINTSGNRYRWEGGKLIEVVPAEDKSDRSLAAIKAAHPEWFGDEPAERGTDVTEAAVRGIGQVSISQLLEEDRKLIESANMDWPGRTRRFPDYPDCPDCKASALVVFDDADEQFWCYGCNRPFTTGHNPWSDDETQMPDAESEAGYAYGG